MNKVEILKQAEAIQKDIRVIREPSKNRNGLAVRLCGDPYIQIIKTTKADGYSSDITVRYGKFRNKKYGKGDSIMIGVDDAPKLIEEIESLLGD